MWRGVGWDLMWLEYGMSVCSEVCIIEKRAGVVAIWEL